MAIASAAVGGFAKCNLHFFTVLLGAPPDGPGPRASSYCTERPSLMPGLALRAKTCATLAGRRRGLPFAIALDTFVRTAVDKVKGEAAGVVRASTKASPSIARVSGARRGDSMVVAGVSGDSGWETLTALVGTVPERERIARPGVSSVTVTSVTGSERSVRADEEPSGADTARWTVWVRVLGPCEGRTVLLATVIDGPGSGFCVSPRVSLNCGEMDLS